MALENHFERGCPSMPVDWSARLDARGYHATASLTESALNLRKRHVASEAG